MIDSIANLVTPRASGKIDQSVVKDLLNYEDEEDDFSSLLKTRNMGLHRSTLNDDPSML